MRQSFDWLNTTAVPDTDSTGLPALRYALIYVESREHVDSLRRVGIYYSQLPIFVSDVARYEGKCGVVDNTGDLQGGFLYALVPAAAYNLWRDASINIINAGAGPVPFRAVILPPIPEPSMANPDGTVSWQALKAGGFDYTRQRALQQPLFGIDIPIIDDALEVVAGALIAGPVGAGIVALVQIGEEIFEPRRLRHGRERQPRAHLGTRRHRHEGRGAVQRPLAVAAGVGAGCDDAVESEDEAQGVVSAATALALLARCAYALDISGRHQPLTLQKCKK
jgi:hypothetical protein